MSESEEDVRELPAGARHALVGVNRAGGPPQLSIVWFVWDGQSFRFSTTRSRAKYLNLQRDPAISLLIDDFEKKFYVVAYAGHSSSKTTTTMDAGPGDHRTVARPPPDRPVTAAERCLTRSQRREQSRS